ncbi:hypothetical protein TRFO_12929 [Tritrichomonas foetus]|uniref:Uncharacterized protein n=1 Tax=Tritrichomonas foetus TaxID=1144522 RepID=A0A1J4L4I0_9EUKA|nr:hypothetical protein TRFO_12929 [Tritrichomonas foetus]|eukprot:OHT16837.1 hypothetical protein TRFO_12929 [Tritrichomonas foetus]
MLDRKLNEQEILAIESILDDAERKFLPKSTVSLDLETLDQQCRDIWDDWDFSVPAYSRTAADDDVIPKTTTSPNRFSRSKLESLSSSDSDSETPEYINTTNLTRQNLSEDEESSDSEVNIKTTRSPMQTPYSERNISTERYAHDTYERSDLRQSSMKASHLTNTSTKTKTTRKTTKKRSPTKSTASSSSSSYAAKVQVQAYDRSDAARLRQDNIALRAQVSRLQAALDRANKENNRLKEELNKCELRNTKQKSVIAYLKEQKLYGRK